MTSVVTQVAKEKKGQQSKVSLEGLSKTKGMEDAGERAVDC